MYVISEEAVLSGEIASIWQTATDVAHWADWDPHEEKSRIDGAFAPGTKGWVKPKGAPAGPFTIIAVDEGSSWTSEAGIPFGKIRGHYTYATVGDGAVRVVKRMEIHGSFRPIFRLIWEKGIRSDMHLSFAALERAAQRRCAANTADA